MREYELIYITQPDCAPEKEKDLQTRIGDQISRADGVTLMWDDWGKRKLAYEIKKFQKGHYVLVNFLGAGRAIPEIERGLRLDPDVLRFLTVKVSDKVKDVEARIAEAKQEEAERAKRREERERLEAERAAKEQAALPGSSGNGAAAEERGAEAQAAPEGAAGADEGKERAKGDAGGEVDTPEGEE